MHTMQSVQITEDEWMYTTDTKAHHVHTYEDALAHVKHRLAEVSKDAPLFLVTPTLPGGTDLWDVFLSSIEPSQRQHYTCNACKHFIRRYGSLAVIVDGRIRSALWNAEHDYPHGLTRAFAEMAKAVARGRVATVFRSSTAEVGIAHTGEWSHFAARVGDRHLHRSPLTTAAQAQAEKREEFAMLSRALGEFSYATVQQAKELLKSGQLYRAEKCQGVADWLLALYDARRDAPSSLRENITWLAVAAAPAGWCHVRSGMIGTLLEDVQANLLPFDEIKRRFDAKMHPLQYLRPQAAPSEGNIAQAERVVSQLRTAGALERRFARLEDIDAFWLPPKEAEKPHASGGVFGHLRHATAPARASSTLPETTMTWVKFRDTVLPNAKAIEFKTSYAPQCYGAIVTAANPDAPPILQWDRDDRRNPASWYVYNGGSLATQWNLPSSDWVRVNAFTLRPCHWHGNVSTKEGEGCMAILQEARDTRHRSGGGGFFPESLRSEYHAVRRTMEAYAKAAPIADRNEATACGVLFGNNGKLQDIRFRVTTKTGSTATYRIDRWD